MSKKIAVLVGSLRKDSYNLKVAEFFKNLENGDLELEIIDIGHLAHYNEDLDKEPLPEGWEDFRTKIKGADGFLFVTPEYNRSVPSALKNALDIGSRPYGQNAWAGKPGAVVSVSQSALGGFGANHALRQSMVFLDVPLMQQPEAYIGQVQNLLQDDGSFVKDTQEFLKQFMQAYQKWVSNF